MRPRSPAVFVFAQHGCPACENYVPRLQQLAAGAPFPVGVYDLASDDNANNFASKIIGRVTAVPVTVVMSRSGKLRTHVGALGDAQIRQVLASALR